MTFESREVRFWAKVDNFGDCWLWTGAKDGMGYGMFGVRASRCERAHRVSYRMAHGDIPGGMCVLHRCDNPACVRPDHLFLGTRDDNMRDRQAKQRQARGERAGRAVLTERAVRDARTRRASGELIKDIAAKYGVNAATMGAAISGRTWRHV